MRCALLIVGLLAAVLAPPAWGQRHGGGGFAGHPTSGFHGPAFGSAGPGRGSRFGGSFGGGTGFHSGVSFGHGFRRPFFHGHFGEGRFGHARFFSGYPFFYPYVGTYYADPGFYGSYDYPPQPAFQTYNTAASYSDTAAQIQQDEIDRLENEVDRLREERDGRSQPPPAPEPQSATVLVFRDQHKQEVQNYAIVGQTLWIFTEQQARKVPLSDLDVTATTKANEDRGIDFRLP
jgi:hypothetical protein